MNVLHVYKTYLPEDFTGVPRVIHGLATGMAPLGVESHVLALGNGSHGDVIRTDGHTVHLARRDLQIASTGLSVSAFRLFRELSGAADVVHYHFPWPMADLLHFSARPGGRTVVTYHSDIVKQRRLLTFYAPLRNRFLADVSDIVATSPNYLHSSSVLRRFEDKVSVIPIGLPDQEEPSAQAVEAWQRRVGEGFFLFVGALRYYKGLQFLMAASRIAGLPIVVAGAGDQSPWQAEAGPNVKFVGAISEEDKSALLHLCRAFVFPSHLRSEAFGVSLVEAARAGRPLISAEIGTGTSFVNLHGVTGLTVPPADPRPLAEAMQYLAKNRSAADAMGRGARARFETELTQEKMISRYLSLYRGELANQARG